MVLKSDKRRQRERFNNSFPDAFFLDIDNIENTTQYLRTVGWLEQGDSVSEMERLDHSVMNYVVRVIPDRAPAFVLKQSRPWIENFPEIDAPVFRSRVEFRFSELAHQTTDLQKFIQMEYEYDEISFMLKMKEFQNAESLADAYGAKNEISISDIDQVLEFLATVNGLSGYNSFPRNMEMRRLNHHFAFVAPYTRFTEFELDDTQEGLADLKKIVTGNISLKHKVISLGEKYLQGGNTIQHGNLELSNILRVGESIKIVDSEFAFQSVPEWDAAVFMAHLYLSDSPSSIIEYFTDNLNFKRFDHTAFFGFAGIEIISRLLGLCQLPVTFSIDQKEELIKKAIHLIDDQPLES
ncbi:MAG TPA: hypothetical protein DEQ34_09055 [Balneolaceae bacterium]|nr:hypothetical protein [Balneolaceae bacterium]